MECIVHELKRDMSVLVKNKYTDRSQDAPSSGPLSSSSRAAERVNRSMSFQASVAEVSDTATAEELMMKCAAIISLERDAVDDVVIQIVCWLPSFLFEFTRLPLLTPSEALMRQAIDVWRWMLAEIPVFHVGARHGLHRRATSSARSAMRGA